MRQKARLRDTKHGCRPKRWVSFWVGATIVVSVLWGSVVCGQQAALYEAAKRGDVTTIRELLLGGADANMSEDRSAEEERTTCEGLECPLVVRAGYVQEDTPLAAAAKGGHAAAVAVLLAAGADPNLSFGPMEELTALGAVLASRQSEETVGAIVGQLISGGVEVNDYSRPSHLHRAAEQGYARVVSVLLRAGAKLDAKDSRGRTPLDLAVQAGKEEVAQVLRSAGKSRGTAD